MGDGIDITNRGSRGFHQYGEPVKTTYGEEVEVYESSAASGPHCWLRIYAGIHASRYTKGHDMTAHLSLEQAASVRDRLTAFIDEAPTRWAAGGAA